MREVVEEVDVGEGVVGVEADEVVVWVRSASPEAMAAKRASLIRTKDNRPIRMTVYQLLDAPSSDEQEQNQNKTTTRISKIRF